MIKTITGISSLLISVTLMSSGANASPECPGADFCIANTIDSGGGGGQVPGHPFTFLSIGINP